MKKVVFLKVSRDSPGDESRPHATALVLQKTADGFLSIQGHAPVAWAERHQCWLLFRKAAKSLLGVCESLPVSVSLSEPPHSTVADLADVFRQPSHIVSLTLSPLPHESELEREADRRKNDRTASSAAAGRNCCTSHGPTPTASGLYQPPRPSPLSSPQAKRRARTPAEDRREMNRLLAGLDEVSQTLERTQSRCDDIARRCESGGRARSAGEEETDWASDDQRVERLLRVAESLAAQIMVQQRRSPTPSATTSSVISPRQPGAMTSSSPERGGVPDPPTDVSAQPSLNGGVFIFWKPVRLDDRDRNNGCKVSGYAVYVDGVQRSKVDEPFGSHVELEGLEGGVECEIGVRTLSSDGRESSLSPQVLYRHEARSPSSSVPASSTAPQQQTTRQSSKVENWLLTNSQSSTRLSPSHDLSRGTPERNLDETTPPGHTHLPEDTWSMGSSHTSGIVMDHPPGSPKLTPSCPSFCHGDGFSVHSGATTTIVDGQMTLSPYHHHQLRFSPSPTPSPSATPSRARSLTPRRGGGDPVIDEPLDFNSISGEETEISKAAATVQLVAGSGHRGPAAPTGVQVSQRQPGWLHISWTPTKRDGKGCSNGCFVLGYRVYINGAPRASVDGPMSYETSLRWPHLDSAHQLDIHMRTRSIAAESLPSTAVLYDMILQESVEKYASVKVSSPLSSTTTLCPSNSPHPHPLRKPSPTRTQGSVARETYV